VVEAETDTLVQPTTNIKESLVPHVVTLERTNGPLLDGYDG